MTEIVRIESYVQDQWIDGEGEGSELYDPSTGEVVATASTRGVDMRAALEHARTVGGPNLRALTFAERGEILKGLSGRIRHHRDELLELALRNGGNTASDGKFDLDGASGTFFVYSTIGKSLGDRRHLVDGDPVPMGKETPFQGRHVWTSRRGTAVCVNAFNFPAWGLAEKMACAFLGGMPVVVKPATLTGLVAHRVARIFVESGLLPAGTFTFLAGPAGDLLDHLEAQDVLAFTGSAVTGRRMRSHPRVLEKGVRVNVEADSLNAAVLGPDVEPGSETWALFVRETAREMTQKAGQKCTATRRILVPFARLDAVAEALAERLARTRVGNPADETVSMGPVASRDQLEDVREGMEALARVGEVVFGDPGLAVRHDGGEPEAGCFVGPLLVRVRDGREAEVVHSREVFGPAATLVPYDGTAQDAADLVARGEGSLVSSVYSDDRAFVEAAVLALAPYNGRVNVGSRDIASESWGPGAVPPGLVHGGPGRAGGGEELGGIRGLHHYMQRTAIEGSGDLLAGLFD